MKKDCIRFRELREKEVVSLCDCRRLGCVTDLIVNSCTGCIEALILPGPGKICGFLGYDSEYVIPFACVRCIGPDIILVEVSAESCLKQC